jgi:hypothetical protein
MPEVDWTGYAEWEETEAARQAACPHERMSYDVFGYYGNEFATGVYCADCSIFLGAEYA